MNANDKISQWMGRECTCVTYDNGTKYWGGCAMHGNGGRPIPWQTSDRRAVELLPVLVEKGYWYVLQDKEGQHSFMFGRYADDVKAGKFPSFNYIEQRKPAISEAITSAVLALIEREKP